MFNKNEKRFKSLECKVEYLQGKLGDYSRKARHFDALLDYLGLEVFERPKNDYFVDLDLNRFVIRKKEK